MSFDAHENPLDRRHILCGGGAMVFSAMMASLLGGSKPVRAETIAGSVPEVDRVSIRICSAHPPIGCGFQTGIVLASGVRDRPTQRRSLARLSRSARLCMIVRANIGVSCTRCKKALSVMGETSQSVAARAVALRGAPSISAISPKLSPADRSSIVSPLRSILTLPEQTTYIFLPWDPSIKITSPAANFSIGRPTLFNSVK